jgi:hypothetical protein
MPRTVLLALLLSIITKPACAEGNAASLVSIITDVITQTAGMSADPAITVHPLNPSLLVPDWQESDTNFAETLARFDTVPAPDGTFPTNSVSIPQILKSIGSDVELGRRELTESDKDTLKRAQDLLYLDPATKEPTAAYLEYLAFEKKYNSLKMQFDSETNEAARIGLRAQMDALKQNWEIFGRRSEMENALAIVASLTPNEGDQLYASWLQTVDQGSSLEPRDLSTLLGAPNWVHISFTPRPDSLDSRLAELGRAKLTLGNGGMLRITTVSFDFARFNIRRRILDHPFLGETNWRLKDQRLLSDGDPATTDGSELLPRVVDQLILIRNIEIHFSPDLPLQARDALMKQPTAVVAGLVLANRASSRVVYQPGYIGTAQSIIIALAIKDLPRIPNPSPSQRW